MKLVCKTRFGSHLYGTATPTSDIDIRGVFIPSSREILLGRIPKTNKEQEAGNEDDYELFSLHHFVKLACEGQTVAFDMLWTPNHQIVLGDAGHVWAELVSLRHKFLSKRMNAFIGYARGQAAKYSLKGERLNKLEAFLGGLKDADSDALLGDHWLNLPVDDQRRNPHNVLEIQVAGKWFGASTKIKFVRESLQATLDAYGSRASAAAGAGGVDWKAMSHAVRVSLELRELLQTQEISFPLDDAHTLLKIKKGEMTLENVQFILDEVFNQVENLTANSSLPEKVDREFWDNWLAITIAKEMIS